MSLVPAKPAFQFRSFAFAALCLSALALSGCVTSETGELATTIDREQGSSENINSLSDVISANANDPEAYNVRGSAYGRAGNYRAAMNRALQLNPQYDAAYIGRGNLYRNAGRTNEAFADFERAIQLDTTDPRAYHNRGLIYQSRGQHDFAIEDFSTAISLAPDAPEPYNGRGVSYLARNDDVNAFADFNQAIKLNGNLAESWANQALVYERRKEFKAEKSYQRAVILDGTYQPAQDGLKRVRSAT
jgi:tetratricopeptide (TPR) repeat protein